MNELRLLSVLSVVCMLAALLGCEPAAPMVKVTGTTPIAFTFPASWRENSKEHPYDLQCLSADRQMNTGIFAYRHVDLPEGTKPIELFQDQIDDMNSRRTDVQPLAAQQTEETTDKRLTTAAYQARRDGNLNCYRYCLIEFKSDPTRFAIVVQVALPENWPQDQSTLAQITASAQALPEPP